MSHKSCCVVNCKKSGRKSDCNFYKFPTASWKINQRKKWIAAVRRQNVDGSLWIPKVHDYICSDHFIGGQKSDIESSPSYIPTKFPAVYKSRKVNESTVTNRFKRLMDRRQKKNASSALNPEPEIDELKEMITEDPSVTHLKVDQEIQVNFYSESDVNSQTFICNRYITGEICHAETQTEIIDDTGPIKVKI